MSGEWRPFQDSLRMWRYLRNNSVKKGSETAVFRKRAADGRADVVETHYQEGRLPEEVLLRRERRTNKRENEEAETAA